MQKVHLPTPDLLVPQDEILQQTARKIHSPSLESSGILVRFP